MIRLLPALLVLAACDDGPADASDPDSRIGTTPDVAPLEVDAAADAADLDGGPDAAPDGGVPYSEPEPWARPIEDYIAAGRAALGETPFLEGIHDLAVFEDRLYLGYGDATQNLGRVQLIGFRSCDDPATAEFTTEHESRDEHLDGYRQIADTLYMPGIDAIDDAWLGNVYFKRPGADWVMSRTLDGGVHVHDVAGWGAAVYAVGSGSQPDEWNAGDIYAHLWRSRDGGESFDVVRRVHNERNGDARWIRLLPLLDSLYTFGYRIGNDGALVALLNGPYDGAVYTPFPDGHPLATAFVDRTETVDGVAGLVVGVDVGTQPLRSRAWRLEDGEAEPVEALAGQTLVDAYADGGELLVLTRDGDLYGEAPESFRAHVYATRDLRTYTELLSFDAQRPLASLTRWRDDLYFGDTTGGVWRAHLGPPLGLPPWPVEGDPDAGPPTEDAALPSDDAAPPDLDGALSDAVVPDAALPAPDAAAQPEGMTVHDLSGAPPERVAALIDEALAGLGFAAGVPDGPRDEDRIFVGRHYLAWIDETGFQGKINGLWPLVGEGAELDFALRDGDGRALNFLVPGENGAGAWAAGYPGAEHVEFPNNTPEPNDDPACADGDWCNQYAHLEAAPITDPDIPWWSACNHAKPSWDTHFPPVEVTADDAGVTLWYEGPLVKVADGDGNFDGEACGAHFLFPDGVRREVTLRVGYRLNADADHLDRYMQLRNPAGNPAFDGPLSLIGGFVVTSWPVPHPEKRLNTYLRMGDREVLDPVAQAPIRAGRFTAHAHPPAGNDEIFAWLGQPISLSTNGWFAPGRSATLSHVGEVDNDDVGVCFCTVHGGLELGGGLVHHDVSLPIAGGADSPLAVRRLRLPTREQPPARHVYGHDVLDHNVGRADGDAWIADTGPDQAGHMVFGPYADDLGAGEVNVEFRLAVDVNVGDDLPVVAIEVYDADTDELLARDEINRRRFAAPNRSQPIPLHVDLAGRAGHRIETRVFWNDIAQVRVEPVVVTGLD